MTKASPDIAVVGTGIVGAATAYQLRQLGEDVEVHKISSISGSSRPSLPIAAKAFNGPKVEGAFNSEIDAANKAIADLSGGGGESCDE